MNNLIKIKGLITLAFIYLKHGINPFVKIRYIEHKLKDRLSDKEKDTIINIFSHSQHFKNFYVELLYGNIRNNQEE